MHSPSLLRLFIMLSLSISFGTYIGLTYKVYGSLFHDSDIYLTEVGQFGFILATISYLIWAVLYDFVGFKNSYTVILVIQIFLSFSMHRVSKDRLLFKIWVSMSWVCEAGHYSILALFIQEIYGYRQQGRIKAVFLVGFGLMQHTVCLVTKLVIPLDGWQVVFQAYGILSSLSLVRAFYCGSDLELRQKTRGSAASYEYRRAVIQASKQNDRNMYQRPQPHYVDENRMAARHKGKIASEPSSPKEYLLNRKNGPRNHPTAAADENVFGNQQAVERKKRY